MNGGGMRIGAIRGIPIRIDVSFLVVLPLLAYAFGQEFRRAAEVADVPPELLGGTPLAWGLLVALGLFASVLLHEIAHSLYAVRTGGRVRDITLMMIGGVSRLSEPPRSPVHEAVMALVGPLTSVALAGVLYAVHVAIRGSGSFNLQFAFFHLAAMNLVLGVFNLLPAFPLDGGRIVRGLLATRIGARRATRVAAVLGRAFAILFALAGLAGGNVFLVLVAFVVWTGAAAEASQVRLDEALEGVRVAELMTPSSDSVPEDLPALDAAERMLASRRLASPVVSRDGRPIGIVSLAALRRIPRERLHATPVRETMARTPALAPGDDARRAVRSLRELGVPELPVVDPSEPTRLLGTLGVLEVTRALELAEHAHRQHFARRPPPPGDAPARADGPHTPANHS
jgi:Zn-dependent protease